jgi:hypothetical protein
MTNIRNRQTSSNIVFFGGESVKITCNMISCTIVNVPIRINYVPMSCYSCLLNSTLCLISLIKSMPALKCIMIVLATDLTRSSISAIAARWLHRGTATTSASSTTTSTTACTGAT